jgi:hypothetical protein
MRSAVWGLIDIPITQSFNPPVHMGIDIGVQSGTRIYAARRGYVERVQTGMVSVQVGQTYATLGDQRDFYLHGNPAPGIQVGVFVDEGQLIIYSDTVQVDSRFPLTGPHLHFEIQNGHNLPGIPTAPGTPLDPVPILLAAKVLAPPVIVPPVEPPEDEPQVVVDYHIFSFEVVPDDEFRPVAGAMQFPDAIANAKLYLKDHPGSTIKVITEVSQA